MDKIQTLLQKSNLTAEEQSELLVVLKLLSTNELNELADFLENNPRWIEKLYDNYRQKKMAAADRNEKKWQDIFIQEKKELQKL